MRQSDGLVWSEDHTYDAEHWGSDDGLSFTEAESCQSKNTGEIIHDQSSCVIEGVLHCKNVLTSRIHNQDSLRHGSGRVHKQDEEPYWKCQQDFCHNHMKHCPCLCSKFTIGKKGRKQIHVSQYRWTYVCITIGVILFLVLLGRRCYRCYRPKNVVVAQKSVSAGDGAVAVQSGTVGVSFIAQVPAHRIPF